MKPNDSFFLNSVLHPCFSELFHGLCKEGPKLLKSDLCDNLIIFLKWVLIRHSFCFAQSYNYLVKSYLKMNCLITTDDRYGAVCH